MSRHLALSSIVLFALLASCSKAPRGSTGEDDPPSGGSATADFGALPRPIQGDVTRFLRSWRPDGSAESPPLTTTGDVVRVIFPLGQANGSLPGVLRQVGEKIPRSNQGSLAALRWQQAKAARIARPSLGVLVYDRTGETREFWTSLGDPRRLLSEHVEPRPERISGRSVTLDFAELPVHVPFSSHGILVVVDHGIFRGTGQPAASVVAIYVLPARLPPT